MNAPPVARPTLKDVAARAGVAVSTASRALNLPGRISPPTAAKVRAAAEELGYTLGPAGQSPDRPGTGTGTVAIVVPDMANPFYVGAIRGMQARLRASGHLHVLVDTQESADAEEQALRRLASVDGVVLAAARMDDERLQDWADRLPLVTINRRLDGPHVLTDSPGGAVQALEHLASLGHRRIAYAGGPWASWSDRRRRAALRRASRRLGVDVTVLGPYAPRREAGAAAADAALQASATAVITFNDPLAFGVLSRLAERDVDVPRQMSVVGCDDIFGADLVRLTTVHVPIDRAGHHAADLLLAKLEGRSVDTGPGPGDAVVLPTYLAVRATSGPAA